MGCDNLKTEKPTCGTGECGIPDELLLDAHAHALNNNIKEDDDNGFVWFAIVLYFAAMLALLEGFPALTQKTAHGQADVYNVHWPKESAPTSAPVDGAPAQPAPTDDAAGASAPASDN